MIKLLPLIFFILISCSPHTRIKSFSNDTRLKYIGKYELPHNMQFHNTTVGGLSGIDYDSKNDIYYLVSDDRSNINPSRFYTARIRINDRGIDTVIFESVHYILQPDGNVYTDSKKDSLHATDPEAIRFYSKNNFLVWTSEGERIVRRTHTALVNPTIHIMTTEGKFIDSFKLPSRFYMKAIEKGPRQNGVFEGLTFFNNYKNLLVSLEEPIYEDGPKAGLKDSSAIIRIINFDVKKRVPIAQYAYEIDPVAYPANPPGAFKVNGVPEILAINDHQFLVLERSFSTGRKSSTIKIFLAHLDKQFDVSDISDAKNLRSKTISKKLLFNMDSLGIYVDNVEGITFGPVLPNGKRTLLLVADNNFSSEEITQFFLFEIM